MGQAIGDSLAMAVGIAISPIPVVAVVLLLVTPRGRGNASAFLAGWVVGVLAAGTILLLVASGLDLAGSSGQPSDSVSWVKLAAGVALILVAVRQLRRRPRGADEPATPRWMGALDTFTPLKSGGAGIVLSAVNPKNLLLIVAGAAAIGQTGIPAGDQAVALIVFALVASVGVAAPLVLSLALGDRSSDLLERLRRWLETHNAAIVAVILVVIGVKLIGDAIGGFSL